MTKQTNKKTAQTVKKTTSSSNKKGSKNKPKKINKLKEKILKNKKRNIKIMVVSILSLAVLLIFSSYAWFSTSLNVKIKNFNMIVTRNSGLSISFDAINYDNFVEISYDTLIKNLKRTYPNNLSQWAGNGLTPVSTLGISNPNNSKFDIYGSSGVRYKSKKKDDGFITTRLMKEEEVRGYNNYIAFDLFFKNVTGSPVPDNLYFEYGTEVTAEGEVSEEMQGLINSIRIGLVKVGSTSLDANPTTIQNLTCQNCKSVIYEPNSTAHTPLSIERAGKFGVTLTDGVSFPTYASQKAGGPIYLENAVSGTDKLDTNYFAFQNTMTEANFGEPLFSVPDGVTKVRVYVWIEGQDIDSLETDSQGASISISINFIKDTQGYMSYD